MTMVNMLNDYPWAARLPRYAYAARSALGMSADSITRRRSSSVLPLREQFGLTRSEIA